MMFHQCNKELYNQHEKELLNKGTEEIEKDRKTIKDNKYHITDKLYCYWYSTGVLINYIVTRPTPIKKFEVESFTLGKEIGNVSYTKYSDYVIYNWCGLYQSSPIYYTRDKILVSTIKQHKSIAYITKLAHEFSNKIDQIINICSN